MSCLNLYFQHRRIRAQANQRRKVSATTAATASPAKQQWHPRFMRTRPVPGTSVQFVCIPSWIPRCDPKRSELFSPAPRHLVETTHLSQATTGCLLSRRKSCCPKSEPRRMRITKQSVSQLPCFLFTLFCLSWSVAATHGLLGHLSLSYCLFYSCWADLLNPGHPWSWQGIWNPRPLVPMALGTQHCDCSRDFCLREREILQGGDCSSFIVIPAGLYATRAPFSSPPVGAVVLNPGCTFRMIREF